MISKQNDAEKNYSHQNQKKVRKVKWLPWALVGAMGVLLVYQYIGASGTTANIQFNSFNWPSLLAVLICPLMMLFMMSGHSHSNNNSSDSNQEQNPDGHGGCCSGHQHKQESVSKNR